MGTYKDFVELLKSDDKNCKLITTFYCYNDILSDLSTTPYSI